MKYNVRIMYYPNGAEIVYHKNEIERKQEEQKNQLIECNKSVINESNVINQSNINRSINSIYRITRSNNWQYFVTLTFNPELVDSSSFESVSKAFTDFIRLLKMTTCPDLKYIFIPEFHKDKIKLHLHGLISDIGNLKLVDSGHKVNGQKIYNLLQWQLGFSTVTKVQSSDRVSKYITKYLSKEISYKFKGKKSYFASRNLMKIEPVYHTWTYPELIRFIEKNKDKMKTVKSVDSHYTNDITTYIQM